MSQDYVKTKGRIVRIISNLFTVEIDGKKYDCHARGKFRKDNITPLVGDYVEIDLENKYILNILKRKNELQRPMISNVDKAIIVTAVKEPNVSLNLLDKMLLIILFNNIKPVICFTKTDLLTPTEKKQIKIIANYYKKINVEVIYNTKTLLWKKRILKNNLAVVSGQTGAGKSTLLNKLNKKLDLKTSPISNSLGRGVHTTRHVELFDIAGGLIADTPGFSSLDISNMTEYDIKNNFKEFNMYSCPYKDCNHTNEKDCEVKKAVNEGKILKSRYENYLKFISEVK